MLHQEKNNAETVRHVFQALNTGDISNVSDFISPRYFNHESQMNRRWIQIDQK